MEKIQTVLITGSDEAVLGTYQNKKVDSIESKVCLSVEDTVNHLTNGDHYTLGIYVLKDTKGTQYLDTIRAAHMHAPATPIYLINPAFDKNKKDFDAVDLKGLGLRQEIKEEIDFDEMVKKINPLIEGFDIDSALTLANFYGDKVGDEISDKKGLVPVSAIHFLSCSRALFDVFIRLSKSKFIKITQAGDALDTVRVSKYLGKGVTHFYLRKEAQVSYMKYCEHLSTRMILSDSFPDSLKVSQTLNFGDQILALVNGDILSSEQVSYATDFIRNVNLIVNTITPKKGSALEAFLKDIDSYNHGIAATMVGAVIARELGYETNSAYEKVGLGCMFHDIGLKKLPPEIAGKTEAEMSLKEKTLYRSHPELSAEELRAVPEVHDSVSQAVQHHHLRKISLGFPVGVSFQKVSQLAQIIGFANDFCEYLDKYNADNSFNLIEEVRTTLVEEFGGEIKNAFEKAFPEKKSA